jgi:hypothetical protein
MCLAPSGDTKGEDMFLLASLVFTVALAMAARCIGSLPVPAVAGGRFGFDEEEEADDGIRIDRLDHRARGQRSLHP